MYCNKIQEIQEELKHYTLLNNGGFSLIHLRSHWKQCYSTKEISILLSYWFMQFKWNNVDRSIRFRGTAAVVPHIIDLSTNQVHVNSFMQQLLETPEKSPQYAPNRRLGNPQSQCGHLGQNNLLSADSWITIPYSNSLYPIYSTKWNVLFV